MADRQVGVIGAGIGGLVAVLYLAVDALPGERAAGWRYTPADGYGD